MIFETERLLIRKLNFNDLNAFYELESNPNVLKYATGEVKSLLESKEELVDLIAKYDKPNNDFWIYAIELKLNKKFVGTLALVKDGKDDEIGYRFLERYWRQGFATEICKNLILFCKQQKMTKIIGYVVDENIASGKILERFNFKPVEKFISKDINLPETKYELIL